MKNPAKTGVTVRKRLVWLLFLIFAMQSIIAARYAFVQIVWSPQLLQWAKDQWTSDTRIAAKRGRILDRNMNPLAVSGNVERVDVFLKDVNEAVNNKKVPPERRITKQIMANALGPVLNMKPEDILAKLNKRLPNGMPMSSVTLARRIERSQGDKVRAIVKSMKMPGIVITEDTKRYYPNNNFLAQVLGNTNVDGDGRAGLELQYNDVLKGVPGKFMGETDKYHRELPYTVSEYIPPHNGDDLVLTIDQSIQYFTEKALEKGLVDYKAKRISAIVMDPKTGEILAMANKPDYDPNVPIKGDTKSSQALWNNRMVNENFEPGSILKVITAAAAIEENVISSSDRFVCRGSYRVKDRIIHCANRTGHGIQTFEQILQNSCNVGFMMVGEKLNKVRLYKYYNAFGLGKKTNIDLPGEEKGIIKPIDKVGPVELATEAFGQGISVTGIQYITALGAVANNGNMVQPHLVKKILSTDDNGNVSVVKEFYPKVVKKVMSAESSLRLRQMMESVVTKGAAKAAYMPGYHLGGKTGTAQKAVNGKYPKGVYISSFAGMAPVNDPKVVVLVSIDEPDKSNYYAGSTSAPLTKLLLGDIFRYMNIQPDQKDIKNNELYKVTSVPEIRGLKVEDAKNVLRSFKLTTETQGSGNIVYDMSPKPGISIKENSKITLYLGNEKNDNLKVSVPDFTNMTQKEIQDMANSLGIKVVFTGGGLGTSQDVSPKTEINKGSTVNVILEDEADFDLSTDKAQN